jgi:hypothetical protein
LYDDRLKATKMETLFWPTIKNERDADNVVRYGFWICFVLAALRLAVSPFGGSIVSGIFEGLFFFLAGVGVRERSRVAGFAAFFAYLLGLLVGFRSGNVFNIVKFIILVLLLANIRANWLSARWAKDSECQPYPNRLTKTIRDKLVNQLPAFLWPKLRFIFYALACIEILGLLLLLLAPRSE